MITKFLFKKLNLLIVTINFKANRLIHEIFIFNFSSKNNIFTSIWKNNYWGSNESLSGPGSTLLQTRYLIKKLPYVFKKYNIRVLLDAPCGDFNWMKYLLKKVDLIYTGGDIVDELIIRNNNTYSARNIKFLTLDITRDCFPKADLWLCRHTLFHFSNDDIFRSLRIFSKSKIKYILVTNCSTDKNHINENIRTGSWRLLNLTLPPFNLPSKPLYEIIDSVRPSPPMKLYLYSRKQIFESLKK